MDKAVALGPFWTALASHADPSTQLALAGTSRLARDAVVQCAAKATLTLQLSPPPLPNTLGQLRTSGRVLPTGLTIRNNQQHPSLLAANWTALHVLLPQLTCPMVTCLELCGDTWLVDTALLTAISAALPSLSKLVLGNVTTTPPDLPEPDTMPTPAWPALRTLSVAMSPDQDPCISHLMAALGVRAGGDVTNLQLSFSSVAHSKCQFLQHSDFGPMLISNQLHALRKLDLPNTMLWDWGEDGVGGALIRHAPALEHLKVMRLEFDDDEHGTAAMVVPWRIVEVYDLDLSYCSGLPLGSSPGQSPLILRVTGALTATENDDGDDNGAQHLASTAPGKRRVQLECTQHAYGHIKPDSLGKILPVLKLTTTGLSNLILDGIDSEDDTKDLVDLRTAFLGFTLSNAAVDMRAVLGRLCDLPHVTRVEVKADDSLDWDQVDEQLLTYLPYHIDEVNLAGGTDGCPSPEVAARMCMHVSRFPRRQAHPLGVCVPDWPSQWDWFNIVLAAIESAGITTPGVVQVKEYEWDAERMLSVPPPLSRRWSV